MSKIKCIIIEDEPLATDLLVEYVSQTDFLELMATFKNAVLALKYLKDNAVDLIFLDIHLPKIKGLSFLRMLNNPPAVIITTAYHEYAVEGFELQVTDYLLKPFEYDRFLSAVSRVLTSKSEKPDEQAPAKDYLFVNAQSRKVKIQFSDILFIESQKEYIKIVTAKKEYISRMSTNMIEDILPAHLFRRVHRSFIISISKIDSYNSEMVEINGIQVPIGRAYRDVLDSL